MTETELFHSSVPRKLQTAFLRCAVDACKSAYAEANKLGKQWMLDAVPFHRRLGMQTGLDGLTLPKGFSASIEQTEPGTHYTEIRSDKVTITAVTRSQGIFRVEPYKYRETLAREAQMSLFDKTVVSCDRIYALFVFGGPLRAELPTIAQFCFPTPSGVLAEHVVDLIQLYPEVMQQYAPATDGLKPEINLVDFDKSKAI